MVKEYATKEEVQELRNSFNDLLERLNDLNLKRTEDFTDLQLNEEDSFDDEENDSEEVTDF